jgi:hypothetical protein
MSERSKSDKGIKDVMKEFYESWEKTAADQLMKVARNQVFLSAIAQNIERTLNLSGRVKEITQTTMTMMSLPTKQDLDNLTKQIRLMRAALDEVNQKLDILAATALSPVAAAATMQELDDSSKATKARSATTAKTSKAPAKSVAKTVKDTKSRASAESVTPKLIRRKKSDPNKPE